MPILVQNYTWKEAQDMIFIQVPLKGICRSKVDVFMSEIYVKLSYKPFIFEVFLKHPICEEESTCRFTEIEAILELPKREHFYWGCLERGLDRSEKFNLKIDALAKEQIKNDERATQKRTQRTELERFSVSQAIIQDTQMRNKIQGRKDHERNTAMREFDEWRKCQENKNFNIQRGNGNILAVCMQDSELTVENIIVDKNKSKYENYGEPIDETFVINIDDESLLVNYLPNEEPLDSEAAIEECQLYPTTSLEEINIALENNSAKDSSPIFCDPKCNSFTFEAQGDNGAEYATLLNYEETDYNIEQPPMVFAETVDDLPLGNPINENTEYFISNEFNVLENQLYDYSVFTEKQDVEETHCDQPLYLHNLPNINYNCDNINSTLSREEDSGIEKMEDVERYMDERYQICQLESIDETEEYRIFLEDTDTTDSGLSDGFTNLQTKCEGITLSVTENYESKKEFVNTCVEKNDNKYVVDQESIDTFTDKEAYTNLHTEQNGKKVTDNVSDRLNVDNENNKKKVTIVQTAENRIEEQIIKDQIKDDIKETVQNSQITQIPKPCDIEVAERITIDRSQDKTEQKDMSKSSDSRDIGVENSNDQEMYFSKPKFQSFGASTIQKGLKVTINEDGVVETKCISEKEMFSSSSDCTLAEISIDTGGLPKEIPCESKQFDQDTICKVGNIETIVKEQKCLLNEHIIITEKKFDELNQKIDSCQKLNQEKEINQKTKESSGIGNTFLKSKIDIKSLQKNDNKGIGQKDKQNKGVRIVPKDTSKVLKDLSKSTPKDKKDLSKNTSVKYISKDRPKVVKDLSKKKPDTMKYLHQDTPEVSKDSSKIPRNASIKPSSWTPKERERKKEVVKPTSVPKKQSEFYKKVISDTKKKVIPPPRQNQTMTVMFTERVFPTPLRESCEKDEIQWLKNVSEAQRATGFVSGDLRPEEQDPQWCKEKGDCFFKCGNYMGAISAYSHGLKLSTKMPSLYANRAASHLAVGNFTKCIEDCSSALDLAQPACRSNTDFRAKCIARRAAALTRVGMLDKGIDEMKAAVRLQPYNETLKDDLYCMEKAWEQNPDWPDSD